MRKRKGNMNTELPQNQAELLTRIEQDWVALMTAVHGLPATALDTPIAGGWSIKDHLTHINAWERHLLLGHLQGQPRPEGLQVDPEIAQTEDVDKINEAIYQRNRQRSAPDVLADLEKTHTQLIAQLGATPFETLLQPRYPDDPDALLQWVIGNTYDHYQEHLAALKQTLTVSTP